MLSTASAFTFRSLPVIAQQPATLRQIGFLLVSIAPESKEANAFRHGLRDAGYVEGRDVVINWRFAEGDFARVSELARDLIRHKVELVVVESTRAVEAFRRLSTSLPIVMAAVGDPVGSGLVTNLSHPGGMVTGLSLMTAEMSPKRLQLLKDADPRLTRVAILWNPDTPWHTKAIEDLKRAGQALSLELSFVRARTPTELAQAFSGLSRTPLQGLYVMDDAFFFASRKTILKWMSKAQLPTSFADRQFVEEGGLMSYAPNFSDMFKRSAWYVDKILRGAKPGDLPIEQPTKFELIVSLKTAKALNLTLPESILLSADAVVK